MNFIKRAIAVALLQALASCGPSLDSQISEAERGDVSAQVFLGTVYLDELKAKHYGVVQDYSQAVSWFRKAAEQGDAYAMRILGISYREGEGVMKDYAQAAKWFRKGAEQGDLGAQHEMGMAYYGRRDLWFKEPQDFVLAYAWLNLASNGGFGTSSLAPRDEVESVLSPAQLAEAQRLSSNWKKGQSIQREKP